MQSEKGFITMVTRKKKSYDVSESTRLIIKRSQASDSDKVVNNYKNESRWIRYEGFFYTFLCSLCILLSSVFVKKLTYIDPGQLSMVRNLGVLLGNLPIAIYCTRNIFGPKEYVWLLSIRALLGASAMYLNLLAYRLLPMAEASIVLASIPSFVTVAARVHLDEPCGFVQVVSIVLTISGVLTSIRLPEILQASPSTKFTKEYNIGLACAVGCVLILTFTYVSLRKMKDVHFSIILLYLGALGTIENSLITALTSTFSLARCGGWDSMQIMLIGIFGFLGHCFLAISIQKEIVSIVTTSRAAIDIVVSSVLQLIFFNSFPDYYTFVGGFLVIAAVGLLGLWKWLMVQPEDSVQRKRFKWLLL